MILFILLSIIFIVSYKFIKNNYNLRIKSNYDVNSLNHLNLKNNVPTDDILKCINRNHSSNIRSMLNHKHKHTSSINLINQKQSIIFPFESEVDCQNHLINYYPVFEFLNNFTKQYGGVLYSVSIVFLPKNHVVYPHIDGVRCNKQYTKYYLNKDRYHLVLDGSYKYTVNGQTKLYNKGDLWWFNNKKIHSSFAISDRIALIFDVLHNNTWILKSK